MVPKDTSNITNNEESKGVDFILIRGILSRTIKELDKKRERIDR